jgi:hypothetical protein
MIVRFQSLSAGGSFKTSWFFLHGVFYVSPFSLSNLLLFSKLPRFIFALFTCNSAPKSTSPRVVACELECKSEICRSLISRASCTWAETAESIHRNLTASLRRAFEATEMPPSFLFIVNELPTNDNPDIAGGIQPRITAHGRYQPPVVTQGFLAQVPGHVYRWSNGTVSLADGYIWWQQNAYTEGRIYINSSAGAVYPDHYRTATVFYCNHFDKFFTARGDASTRDSLEPEDLWHPLSFFHGNNNVSYVDHAGDQQYLAVRHADWIEQLLPRTYRRHSSKGPANGGLAGLLPIIIALVAFSCRGRDELHRVLINDQAWRGHRWYPHQRDSGRE